jgi:hypothetical protein
MDETNQVQKSSPTGIPGYTAPGVHLSNAMEITLEERIIEEVRSKMSYPVFSVSPPSPHASPRIFAEQLNYPEGLI